MVTGVPVGARSTRVVTSSLVRRTHPALAGVPMSSGRLVPCMAAWPLPPPKEVWTSEKPLKLTW
ncbi:hypothetical protein BH20ACT3_BH20ACT3_17050 [soil metagenome]